MPLVAEHPALKHPDCIGIGGRDGIVESLSIRGNLVETFLRASFRKRHLHFVEAVGKIVSALPEFFLPFLNIFLRNTLIEFSFREYEAGEIVRTVSPSCLDKFSIRKHPLEALRHKSGESIVHRRHSELVHPVYYLVLESYRLVIPLL